MTAARFFDWMQLAALACLACLALPRMLALHMRGARVVVIDWQRTPAQQLADLLMLICLVLWWYEVVAYVWPLRVHLVPAPLGIVLFDATLLKVIGVAVWATGLVIFGVALWAFGASWRIGIDRETPGPLVTGGVFAWMRNPIYFGLDLCAIGTFLVQGRLIFLGLAVAFVSLVHIQIRREECFLTHTYGAAYRDYCGRVGRYVRWR